DLVPARSFQQAARTFDIRADEWGGVQNRTIHVRFRRKIHDGIEAIPREEVLDLTCVGDVTANELIPWIFHHFIEITEISRVCKQVVVHDLDVARISKNISDEAGADEPCAARNKNLHCCLRIEAEFWMAV